MAEDRLDELVTKARNEWPAALAVVVLAAGHLYLTIVAETDATPLGIPLVAAIAVFLLAELGRRIVGRS